MNETFTVRAATADDEWQQACALLRRVYVGGGYTAVESAAQSMTRQRLEAEGTLLIAVRDDRVVIGATILLNADSALRQVALDGEREFRLLGVDPESRGGGVGAALVLACIDRSGKDGANTLVLWTRPMMLDAQRLYERTGFVRALERDVWDERGFTRMVYARLVKATE